MNINKFNQNKIGVIGLGYVGLPLAVEFSKKFKVIGYDKSKEKIKKIKNLKNISDISKRNYRYLRKLEITRNYKDLEECNIYIITVPTPVYRNKKPDLRLLIKATMEVSKIIKNNDLIIFESTVFPGTTEEICVPIIEKLSGLKLSTNDYSTKKEIFFCGYSPERINPTDRTHTLPNTNKIVAGSTIKVSKFLRRFYKTIIKAKIFIAASIKVAEASKMIENVQRDVNIALVNEFAIICNKIGIKTLDVIKAASTKWNFAPFYPGFVGGHCIGIDPYYMAHKAKLLKVKSELILGGRKVNDNMPNYVGKKFSQELKRIKGTKEKKVLIMGITFKENCPDVRNSKAMNLYNYLKKRKFNIDLFDPVADSNEFEKIYKTKLIKKINENYYDGILISVRHLCFIEMGFNKIKKFVKKDVIIFDIKPNFLKKY